MPLNNKTLSDKRGLKRCSGCGRSKSFGCYARSLWSKDGLRSACKKCTRTRKHSYYLQHRKHILKKTKEWADKNKLRRRKVARLRYSRHRLRSKNSDLKRVHGITLRDYYLMFAKQKGKCAICGVNVEDDRVNVSPKYGCRKYFAVDHNPRTGRVRGLLCFKCNQGLGFFKDSIVLLQKAFAYLRVY